MVASCGRGYLIFFYVLREIRARWADCGVINMEKQNVSCCM